MCFQLVSEAAMNSTGRMQNMKPLEFSVEVAWIGERTTVTRVRLRLTVRANQGAIEI